MRELVVNSVFGLYGLVNKKWYYFLLKYLKQTRILDFQKRTKVFLNFDNRITLSKANHQYDNVQFTR